MDNITNLHPDLILRGGHVIDPANDIDEVMEVGIAQGKIVQVEPALTPATGTKIVDVTGSYVTPGILDIHTHVFPFSLKPTSYVECVHADAHLFTSGVTTTVDAGTAGYNHFREFYEGTIQRSKVRILAFLNIALDGMVDATSEQQLSDLNPALAASLARDFSDIAVGIKSAHYWTSQPWDADHLPWQSVDRALEAGAMCGKPVMVDFWPRPPERSYPDLLLKHLRPGDIHTHIYAQQFPILNDQGRVSDFLFTAREKGIRFDLGHGAASFWFRNAVPATQGGFPPDSLSTDLHMANINGPVVGMATTMSKFLNMGMALQEVIRRSTTVPAHMIGRPALGSLSVGSEADVAVFRLQEGLFGFADCGRARLTGSRRLECILTLRAGQVVYDPGGLTMPEWPQAPAEYWISPDLQK